MVMTKLKQRFRFDFFLVIAASMGICISNLVCGAYLPAVGPAPLRFRAPYKPNANTVTTPSPVVSQPAFPAPTEDAEKTPAPALPPPVHEPAPAPIQTNAVVETPPSDGVISPAMLLKYFNRSTNGAAAGVGAPPHFTPAAGVEPQSSKVDSSTPPH
jgi:hypothetical protein